MNVPTNQKLWIEAHFDFPELKKAHGKFATIPGHFAHMQLLTGDGIPCVRVRLTAELDVDGEVNEEIVWVLAPFLKPTGAAVKAERSEPTRAALTAARIGPLPKPGRRNASDASYSVLPSSPKSHVG